MKKSVIEIPAGGIGKVSDGYHTFDELYHHRAVLFGVICNQNKELAWKAKSHDDGTMYANMFIVGIQTPEGQATYHYDVNPYWDMFDVKTLDKAPKWDGHTPAQAIERIAALSKPGQLLAKDAKILKAITILKDNDYIIRKLTPEQEKDLEKCENSGGNMDCMECSCNGCLFD